MGNEETAKMIGIIDSIRLSSNSLPTLRNNNDENYIHAATSDNTRKAYQADIRHFVYWGGRLPTSDEVIMKYLHHHAELLNPRTLARRLTAIKNWHIWQGHADPTTHPAIQKTLTGIKNVHGKPKEKATPLTLETLTRMSAFLMESNRLIDCRNRALLLVGFFGAFRRSELVGIKWSDIAFVPEGMEILVPRSKTDQGGEGQVCALPSSHDAMLCPVAALTEWRERSGGDTDSVFRQITAGGRLLSKAIKPHQINVVIKSIAKSASKWKGKCTTRKTETTGENVSCKIIAGQGRVISSNTNFYSSTISSKNFSFIYTYIQSATITYNTGTIYKRDESFSSSCIFSSIYHSPLYIHYGKRTCN